jgi:hypothetical protein
MTYTLVAHENENNVTPCQERRRARRLTLLSDYPTVGRAVPPSTMAPYIELAQSWLDQAVSKTVWIVPPASAAQVSTYLRYGAQTDWVGVNVSSL